MCLVAGEVSLPGGKVEEGDKDDGDTATREAKEEIGLDPSLVEIVTVLEPFLSKVFNNICDSGDCELRLILFTDNFALSNKLVVYQ